MDELKRGLALVRYHAEKCEEDAARCDWWKSPMMQQRAEALRADARALQAVERAVRDAQRLREALERLVHSYTNGYAEARAALAAAPRGREGEGIVDHARTHR